MTKSQLKYFQSLSQQKYRKEHKVYVVEGDKNVKEWILAKTNIEYIVATEEWIANNSNIIATVDVTVIPVASFEMEKISLLNTPSSVLATVHLPNDNELNVKAMEGEWVLVLDAIQDPGNLGTIIRIADWFGIKHIVCGVGTVDVYNPKVVQATMGSLLRVAVYKAELQNFLNTIIAPIYITYLDGENIHSLPQPIKPGCIVLGNESNGVNKDLLQKQPITKVTIPKFGGAESLNVGIAAGIVCSHFIK